MQRSAQCALRVANLGEKLGFDGGKFYVNSATGVAIDKLERFGADTRGAIPAQEVPQGVLVGRVALRRHIEESFGYGRDTARVIITAASSAGVVDYGFRGLPSAQGAALDAFVEERAARANAAHLHALGYTLP